MTVVPPAEAVAGGLVALVEDLRRLPYGGERVDQRAHALQTAALVAGGSDELVAAALLHDVGYAGEVREAFPGRPHEDAAAAWLEPLLGVGVARLVGAHVAAKRYLVAADRGYATLLSEASEASLLAQGGPASAPEVSAWTLLPWWPDALALRRADDAAKVSAPRRPTSRRSGRCCAGWPPGGRDPDPHGHDHCVAGGPMSHTACRRRRTRDGGGGRMAPAGATPAEAVREVLDARVASWASCVRRPTAAARRRAPSPW